jgi:Holliday junction resolvase
MTPERKLYDDLKKKTHGIIWNRIENLSVLGMPDVLGYNANRKFFTVELKVTRGNKVKFSPHQIAFHKSHPDNTFILLKTRGQCALKLVPGSEIHGLWSRGHGSCFHMAEDWEGIQTTFENIF